MINEDDVQFRKARAGDADWAVPLIVDSAPARFAYFHREQTDSLQAYLRDEFSSNAGLFSYRHHVAVEYRGAPAGVVSLFRSAAAAVCSIGTLYHMVRSLGLPETLGVLSRRHYASGRMPLLSRTSVYMDNLCVEPHLRGRGIGKLIVRHLLHIAAANGYRYLYCDVEYRNTPARQLYQQCGMQFVDLLRSAPFCPLDSFIRLRRDLREQVDVRTKTEERERAMQVERLA